MDERAQRIRFDDAFPDLFDRAYRTAYRLLGDQDAATDVALDTLSKAYSRWWTVCQQPRRWVVLSSGELALSMFPEAGRGSTPTGEGWGDPEALRVRTRRGLSCLPRPQREATLLKWFHDLSGDEGPSTPVTVLDV